MTKIKYLMLMVAQTVVVVLMITLVPFCDGRELHSFLCSGSELSLFFAGKDSECHFIHFVFFI